VNLDLLRDLLPSTFGTPEWSADGKSVTLPDNRTGTVNLWNLPLDGSPMKQLTDLKSETLFSRELSMDGKSMALSRGTVTSDVILISNFR